MNFIMSQNHIDKKPVTHAQSELFIPKKKVFNYEILSENYFQVF